MNSTYNEDPYIILGFAYNKTRSWVPINNETENQKNWDLGIVDFLPYSIIKDSSFNNISVESSLIDINESLLELRRTSITNNVATGIDSSIIIAK